MELLMKTFKRFNEEAQYHLHEYGGDSNLGFIPLISKGVDILGKLSTPLYRGFGAYETGKNVYKSIKDKKGPAHTALSALSGIQYAAPWKGKNTLHKIGNFVKSKRFITGLGAETAAEYMDDAEKAKKNTPAKYKNYSNNVRGAAGKASSNIKPKKYLTDLDLYKK